LVISVPGHAGDALLRRALARDHVEQLVAVVDRPARIRHDEAIAVAVQRDAQVGLVPQHRRLQLRGRGGAEQVVDVEAVRRHAHRHHVRAQLVEHVRRHAVGRAVGAIHHQLQPAQVEMRRKRRLAELDVAPARIVHAPRAPQVRGRIAADRLLEQALDLGFHGVGQLEAVAREELDAVVRVGIVRGADYHARLQAQCARQVSHARRGQRAAQQHIDARGGESRLECRLDHVAGDARVLADQHAGPVRLGPLAPREHLAGGVAEAQHEVRRHRRLAHGAPHSVGAEVLARHALRHAS
jgi:hypothetical protein